MATIVDIELSTAALYSIFHPVYLTAHDASASDSVAEGGTSSHAGQFDSLVGHFIHRTGLRVALDGLPEGANITSVALFLYGTSMPADDFNLTIVSIDMSNPAIPADYSKLGTDSYGAFDTSGWNAAGWNEITINVAGLVVLNAARQVGEWELGLRSDDDISSTPGSSGNVMYVGFRTPNHANIPYIKITYDEWPATYPSVPTFPLTGKIDLVTYSMIRSYMTELDRDLSAMTDGDGNVDLAVANYIWWTGTSERLAYSNGSSHVSVTTLESTSGLTLECDLVTADLTVTTTGTAVDSTVANDALLSNTAHASIKAKITDNEIGFDAIPSASPADDEADIYLEIATGDLLIKTRDDGQAGVKTDKLGDFSAM